MMVAIIERATHIMDAKGARQAARDWVKVNAGQWSGLRAAHLVSEITAMAAEARAAAVERAIRLYGRVFMLAEEIAASHPEVVD